MPTTLLSAQEATAEVQRLTGLKTTLRTFNKWAATGRIETAQRINGRGARLFAPADVARLAAKIRKERLVDPRIPA